MNSIGWLGRGLLLFAASGLALCPPARAADDAAGGKGPWPPKFRCGTADVRGRWGETAVRPRRPAPRAGEAGGSDGGRGAGRRAVRHVLANWIETEHFSLEWGNDMVLQEWFGGPNPAVDVDGNGLPDVIEEWASYFEASYAYIVGQMGFDDSLLGEQLIPVYFGNSDARPEVTVEDVDSGTFGYMFYVRDEDHLRQLQEAGMTPEEASYYPVGVPHIVVNNDLLFAVDMVDGRLVLNDEGASAPGDSWEKAFAHISGAMKSTAAHELFHVFHSLYEPPSTVFADDAWWWEATSTWVEDEVFDGVNDYYRYFGEGGWAEFVEYGLAVGRGATTWGSQAYGNAIFAKYLAEHVGGRSAVHDVWELMRSGDRRVLDALDEYARARHLGSREGLFQGFAAVNATMDYEEGAHFGIRPGTTVPVRAVAVEGGSADGVQPLPVPQYLGATYLWGAVPAAPLRFSLVGDGVMPGLGPAPARWGLVLAIPRAGYTLALAAAAADGRPELTVTTLAPGDGLYVGVTYLDDALAPNGYVTAATPASQADTAAPGAVSQLRCAPATGRGPGLGGAVVSWAPPADPDVAGYVVRWRRPGGDHASRTVLGSPLDPASGRVEVEVLRLEPETAHEWEVWAYDGSGNEGPRQSVTAASGGAPPSGVGAAAVLAREVTLTGINVPDRSRGSKGIGGVDCFLRVLGR